VPPWGQVKQGALLGPFEEAIHIGLEQLLRHLATLHPIQDHGPGQNFAAGVAFAFRLSLAGVQALNFGIDARLLLFQFGPAPPSRVPAQGTPGARLQRPGREEKNSAQGRDS